MANEYAQLATLKQYLNIEAADTTRDVMLQAALSAASRLIDDETGRRFYLDASPVTRVYRPNDCLLIVDDIGSTEGLSVSVDGTVVTDFETAPDNALADGRPITSLRLPFVGQRVEVTARFGWPAIPDVIAQATLIQAARLYRRKDSPEGVTGSAEWGVVRLSRTDPDVYALIKHAMIPGFG